VAMVRALMPERMPVRPDPPAMRDWRWTERRPPSLVIEPEHRAGARLVPVPPSQGQRPGQPSPRVPVRVRRCRPPGTGRSTAAVACDRRDTEPSTVRKRAGPVRPRRGRPGIGLGAVPLAGHPRAPGGAVVPVPLSVQAPMPGVCPSPPPGGVALAVDGSARHRYGCGALHSRSMVPLLALSRDGRLFSPLCISRAKHSRPARVLRLGVLPPPELDGDRDAPFLGEPIHFLPSVRRRLTLH
jgi:hypothetical protein